VDVAETGVAQLLVAAGFDAIHVEGHEAAARGLPYDFALAFLDVGGGDLVAARALVEQRRGEVSREREHAVSAQAG
jgi:hypothetical protein